MTHNIPLIREYAIGTRYRVAFSATKPAPGVRVEDLRPGSLISCSLDAAGRIVNVRPLA
jgi:hypothetical protein